MNNKTQHERQRKLYNTYQYPYRISVCVLVIVAILGPFGKEVTDNGTLVHNKANTPAASRRLYRGEVSLLSALDCHNQLVFGRTSTVAGRIELKGGPIDALIVEATKATKKDFAYQEAFVTTYRTFLSSEELIDKLLFRYGIFSQSNEVNTYISNLSEEIKIIGQCFIYLFKVSIKLSAFFNWKCM